MPAKTLATSKIFKTFNLFAFGLSFFMAANSACQAEIDYAPYMNKLQACIKQQWKPQSDEYTQVITRFYVEKSGRLDLRSLDIVNLTGSIDGIAEYEAQEALEIASEKCLFPLPEEAGRQIKVEFKFTHNPANHLISLDSQVMSFFRSKGKAKYQAYKEMVTSNQYLQTSLLNGQMTVISNKNLTGKEKRLMTELKTFTEMKYFSPLKERIKRNNLHINVVLTSMERHPVTNLPILGLNSLVARSTNPLNSGSEGLIILGAKQKLNYRPTQELLEDGSVQFNLTKTSPMVVFLNEMNELVDAQEYDRGLVSTIEYQSASAAIDMAWTAAMLKLYKRANGEVDFTRMNAAERDAFLKRSVSLMSPLQLKRALRETKESVTSVYERMEGEITDPKMAKQTAFVLNQRLKDYFGDLSERVKFVVKENDRGLYTVDPVNAVES